jgi:hypothetical protein
LELHHLGSSDGREIVGLVDDDASLHFLWVYGYQVLGGRKDLPELISQHGLTGIVVTALLTPESRAAIHELALQYGLDLSEWRCEECEVGVTLPPKVIPFDDLNPPGAGDRFQTVSAVNNPTTPHGC